MLSIVVLVVQRDSLYGVLPLLSLMYDHSRRAFFSFFEWGYARALAESLLLCNSHLLIWLGSLDGAKKFSTATLASCCWNVHAF